MEELQLGQVLFSGDVSPSHIATAILTFLITFVAFVIGKTFFAFIKRAYKKKDKNSFIYIASLSVGRFSNITVFVISIYVGFITLPINTELSIYRALEILLLLLLFYSLGRSFNFGIRRYAQILSERVLSSSRRNYLLYSSVIVRSSIWIFFGITFLSNIGIELSAIIAALGLSGFALAIAFRNLLKDILASFVIVLDKIVEVGDSVKVSDEVGVLKAIGIKSSRIITDDGLEIIIPNTHLVDKKVQNLNSVTAEKVTLTLEIGHTDQNVPAKVFEAVNSDKHSFILSDSFSVELSEISNEKKIYSLSFMYPNSEKDNKDKNIDTIINEIYYSLVKDELELRVAISNDE